MDSWRGRVKTVVAILRELRTKPGYSISAKKRVEGTRIVIGLKGNDKLGDVLLEVQKDAILKVAQEDSQEWTNIVGARVRDAVKIIRGKKGSTVRLQVKHPTGEIQEISIVRDIVVIEETYSKHLIINDTRFENNNTAKLCHHILQIMMNLLTIRI